MKARVALRCLPLVVAAALALAACESDKGGLGKGPSPVSNRGGSSGDGTGGKGQGGQAGQGSSDGTGGASGTAGSSGTPDAGVDAGKVDVLPASDGKVRPTSSGTCNFGFFVAKPVKPEVLLVFDRSSAMRKPASGSTNTRWVEMTEAVTEALTKQATTSWGLKLFPSSMGCLVNDGADVAVGPGRFNDVVNKIRGSMPAPAPVPPVTDEGAPIAQGVAAALQAFPASDRPRFLVLASDGNPGCPPPALSEAAIKGAYDSVKNAVTNQVRTFVIGTAAPASKQHMVLNELAASGREANAGETKYWVAQNKEQMVKALSGITDQLNSCLFEVSPAPPAPKNVSLDLGPELTRVPRDENQVEGWNYGPDYKFNTKSIRIYGSACTRLRANPATPVEMVYGCQGVTPSPAQ
jgi:hypothetical protein